MITKRRWCRTSTSDIAHIADLEIDMFINNAGRGKMADALGSPYCMPKDAVEV